MSMNLQIKGFDLWQTPTWVTDICLSYNSEKEVDGGREGVARRYIIWVKSHLNGVWQDDKECTANEIRVSKHIKELTVWLKANLVPEFYEM